MCYPIVGVECFLKQKESKDQFALSEKILQYVKISADSEGLYIDDIVSKIEQEGYSVRNIQLEVFHLVADGFLVEMQPGRYAALKMGRFGRLRLRLSNLKAEIDT